MDKLCQIACAAKHDGADSGMTLGLQGLQGHANRVRQSSAAQQSQMLNIDFQSIVAGLQAASYQSQELVKQDIQEICRTAAESFSSQEQVPICIFLLPPGVSDSDGLSSCHDTDLIYMWHFKQILLPANDYTHFTIVSRSLTLSNAFLVMPNAYTHLHL